MVSRKPTLQCSIEKSMNVAVKIFTFFILEVTLISFLVKAANR
jgi:hypothetical protein